MDKLECSCGNPACRQSLVIRKGAVFYPDHKLIGIRDTSMFMDLKKGNFLK